MDLTPDESARLKELKLALEQEFAQSSDADAAKRKTAIEDLEALKPDCLEALSWIMKHSTSESLKAKVAMWTYDRILDIQDKKSNPLGDFFAGMDAASKEKSSKSS